MQALNLPPSNFQFSERNGKTTIWDRTRKKYIILSPEEWVRQNFVEFLIQEKHFLRNLIKIETGLKVLKTFKRTDVLCYNKSGKPILLVECKAPEIKINQHTFDQIARYNISLQVPYLIVTNGMNHYCCSIDFENKSYLFHQTIPSYHQIADL